MLKYGYLSFEFKVLEIIVAKGEANDISTQRETLLAAEQKYINMIQPEYNILSNAGSNLGRKLSEITKQKMSTAKKGVPSHRKNSVHSLESKAVMRKNSTRRMEVYVYSSENLFLNYYHSINECSIALRIDRRTIRKALASGSLVDNKYYFSPPQWTRTVRV
jgi:hypothetical protein